MDGHSMSRTSGHAARLASLDHRGRSEESWIEISSQPSSSSLSSAADEVVTTGLRVEQDGAPRRKRSTRSNAPSSLRLANRASNGGASSQEEYDESESESDRIMTSSNEEETVLRPNEPLYSNMSPAMQSTASDDDDENRTAINYPIRNDDCFTPQPNAFSHPPSAPTRHASLPVPGSYFPAQRSRARTSVPTHHSVPNTPEIRQSHVSHNILSPSYNAAAHHDEALRNSLTTLLSCAAAARGLQRSDSKRPNTTATAPIRPSNRIEGGTFRLVPESALPTASSAATSAAAAPRTSLSAAVRQSPRTLDEPTFQPTLRRGTSDSTTASSSANNNNDHHHTFPEAVSSPKRKDPSSNSHSTRNSSRERRALKKARRNAGIASSEDLLVTPTLTTWILSAGVVVALSALSFHAGYSMGREAGRLEGSTAGGLGGEGAGRVLDGGFGGGCAREAGRGLGLKRSLARSAVQA